MHAIELDRVSSRAGDGRPLGGQHRGPRRRVHRRVRPQRRRQDDAAARHPRPAATRAGRIRCSARRLRAAIPRAGYLPQHRDFGRSACPCVVGTSSPARLHGERWGLPFLGRERAPRSRPGDRDRRRAGARRRAAVRALRRRAAAAAARAGAARQSAAAAARRAAAQPRSAFRSMRVVALVKRIQQARASRCCLPRTSSTRCSRRWTACSTSATARRDRHGRRGHDRRSAVRPVRHADRSAARERPIVVISGTGAGRRRRPPSRCLTTTSCARPSRPVPSSRSSPARSASSSCCAISTFAGHALSHVGFAGADRRRSWSASRPLWGLLAFTLAAARRDGAARRTLARTRRCGRHRPVARARARRALPVPVHHACDAGDDDPVRQRASRVEPETVWTLLALGVASLARARGDFPAAAVCDLAPELAEAKGVSLRLVSVLFLAIVAVAVAAKRRRSSACCSFSR